MFTLYNRWPQRVPNNPEGKVKRERIRKEVEVIKMPNLMQNMEGKKKENKKVKFPCNICGGDHLTHQCPQMEEAHHLLTQQQPVVLKNPFPQGKNMQAGSSTANPQGGTQNAPLSDGSMSFINMVNHKKEEEVDFSTRSHDYGNPESTSKGKETLDPQNSLHIENPEKETMPHIPKGVYKCVTQPQCLSHSQLFYC
jgi:hypothetical protein